MFIYPPPPPPSRKNESKSSVYLPPAPPPPPPHKNNQGKSSYLPPPPQTKVKSSVYLPGFSLPPGGQDWPLPEFLLRTVPGLKQTVFCPSHSHLSSFILLTWPPLFLFRKVTQIYLFFKSLNWFDFFMLNFQICYCYSISNLERWSFIYFSNFIISGTMRELYSPRYTQISSTRSKHSDLWQEN